MSDGRSEGFSSFKSLLWACAPCVLASLLIYLPAFDNGFRDDDFVFLEHVRTARWDRYLIDHDTRFAFHRPGQLLLFRAEHLLFGDNSGLYIVLNFLVHVITALVGATVLSRMNLRRSTVLTAVALFLLGYGHYGKEVMWASAGGPLVANLLVVLALALARPGEPAAGRSRWLTYPFLVIAPAFHESAILTGWLVFVVPRLVRPRRAPLLATVMTLSTVFWIAVRFAFAGGARVYSPSAMTLLETLPRYLRYLGFLAMPVQYRSGAEPVATAAQAVLGVVVVLVMARMWWRDRAAELPLWVLVALAPFALVSLPGGWLELRYLYPAALPWAAIVALLLARVRAPALRRGALITVLVLSASVQLALEKKYDAVSSKAPAVERATSTGSGGLSDDHPWRRAVGSRAGSAYLRRMRRMMWRSPAAVSRRQKYTPPGSTRPFASVPFHHTW